MSLDIGLIYTHLPLLQSGLHFYSSKGSLVTLIVTEHDLISRASPLPSSLFTQRMGIRLDGRTVHIVMILAFPKLLVPVMTRTSVSLMQFVAK